MAERRNWRGDVDIVILEYTSLLASKEQSNFQAPAQNSLPGFSGSGGRRYNMLLQYLKMLKVSYPPLLSLRLLTVNRCLRWSCSSRKKSLEFLKAHKEISNVTAEQHQALFSLHQMILHHYYDFFLVT